MKKKEQNYSGIELRSEEVQEVMSQISPFVIRWGITVISTILFIILVGCWIFRYPDTLSAEITLATEEPPAFILANSTGKLDTLYINNGDIVETDAHLGIITNAASSKDIKWLSTKIKLWKKLDFDWQEGLQIFANKNLQLGQIQSAYAAFITSLNEYGRFMKLDYYTKKIHTQEVLLQGQRNYLALALKEYYLIEKDIEVSKSMYTRDSILYARKAMIAAEFEESKSKYLQSLRSKENARMNLVQAEMQLSQQKEKLLDIHKQAFDEEETRRTELKNSIEQLNAQLSGWEQSYLLKSPISGKVSFMTVWSRNQNVKSGETVFIIQPTDSSSVLGKALLPLQGSGKVHVGQSVHIRLNNYPDQEFGYVKGKVKSISPAPTEDNKYVVEIVLLNGLRTNYGKNLPVSRELKGTADIILAKRNVLERLLSPLRKIIKYED